MKITFVFVVSVLAMMGCMSTGCASMKSSHQNRPSHVRNQQLAAELTADAVQWMGEDPIKAKIILREALQADLYHGPAHNNLGVLFLKRGELYQAAEEFDWARRLMPGHPDPRINLGLALERGGKYDDALDAYASAIEVYPEHLPAVQALARCQIRHGQRDEYTDELLRIIVFRGSSEWKIWARTQLATK